MKSNRFFRLFLLLLAVSAGLYFFSCQSNTEPTSQKPFIEQPATERACGTNECLVTITMDTDIVVDLCGGIPGFSTQCTACGNNNNTGGASSEFEEDVPRQLCVDNNGNLCITNLATNVSSVWVTVQYGSSTPITVSLIPGQTHCFHTNGSCDTIDGCI